MHPQPGQRFERGCPGDTIHRASRTGMGMPIQRSPHHRTRPIVSGNRPSGHGPYTANVIGRPETVQPTGPGRIPM